LVGTILVDVHDDRERLLVEETAQAALEAVQLLSESLGSLVGDAEQDREHPHAQRDAHDPPLEIEGLHPMDEPALIVVFYGA